MARIEPAVQQDVSAQPVAARGRWRDAWRVMRRNRLSLFGLAVMGLFAVLAVFAPLIAPYDPLQQALVEKFAQPSPAHPLGQDQLGRDILSRIIHGARVSLTAGIAAVVFATVVGTLIGVVAGFFGGWLDSVLMRLMDILLAFPSILLAIVIVTVLGQGLAKAMLAVGIVSVPQIARVVRASVLSVRERDYVLAARALGATDRRILGSAILPNILGPLIVQATLTLATAILDVAALSFLGLGATAPSPEWGAMLTDAFKAGFGVFVTGQHAILFPGIAIALSVLAVNFIGDGLRDALDPRRKM
jgi:peptide/nickel transport system permease protein